MATPSIMIGTPCFGGLLTHGYVTSLLELCNYAAISSLGLRVKFLAGDALITRARSTLVATFLDDPALTHLLFIDADITFKPEQLKRLLKFDQEVTAALYPVKSFDWKEMPERARKGEALHQAGLVYVTEHCVGEQLKTKNGFATAEYAGTGFLLIKRQAIEKLIAAYPETKYSAVHDFAKPGQAAENFYALFDCMIDPVSGHYLSEDYSFCRRWRKIGGEIWIDLESKLTHTGPYAFEGSASARYAPLASAKPP